MVQSKINKAYQALSKLSEMSLPIKKARLIYLMMREVERHFQFSVQEEKKLLDEFKGTVHEDGRVSFDDAEAYRGFQTRLMELVDSEVEWDLPPVVISENDLGSQSISASDMLALEDFVLFTE